MTPSPLSLSLTHSPLLLALLLLLSPLAANAHECTEEFRREIQKIKNFTRIQSCRRKILAAEFAWSFDTTSRRLDVAFGSRLRRATGWLAWGVNPHGPQMVGTRALIGVKRRDDSLVCRKYSVTDATKFQRCPLLPADDELGLFTEYSLEYLERNQYYVILATVVLPEEFNSSRIYVVWQVGEAIAGSEPLMHPKSLQNFDGTEVLDLQTTAVVSYTRHQRRYIRLAHGVLNIVGWGTLLPSGVIVARYMRIYPKPCRRWYDVHVSFQTAGYIIGSSGWALGIWMGKTSPNYKFNIHNNVGLLIFIFTTIQMLAWRLRPAPDDGYRTYWNMYHHFLGYSILVLTSFNIFLGIKILEPEHVWKWAYIGVLVGLGTAALAFEVFGWIKFLIEKSSSKRG